MLIVESPSFFFMQPEHYPLKTQLILIHMSDATTPPSSFDPAILLAKIDSLSCKLDCQREVHLSIVST